MKISAKFLGYILRKPVEGYQEMKHLRFFDWTGVAIIVISWFLVRVLDRQLYAFRFNTADPSLLNIFIEAALSIGLFVLFCVANWGLCTLADGEGKLNEIATYTAFALVPYIVFKLVAIPVSHMVTHDEAIFLQWFAWIGLAWSVMLVFQAVRIVHQYSGGRTVFVLVATLAGMLVVVLVLMLLVALFQQIFAFITTVINEVWFRR